MVSRSVVVATLCVFVAIGCSRAPEPTQVAAVASSAQVLLGHAHSGEIPQAQWPAEVAQLQPERVRATPEGVYVVLFSAGVEERGLFVPRSPDFAGSTGTDPSYTPAGQGVFSYHVKG